jgi:hypothetical protein
MDCFVNDTGLEAHFELWLPRLRAESEEQYTRSRTVMDNPFKGDANIFVLTAAEAMGGALVTCKPKV